MDFFKLCVTDKRLWLHRKTETVCGSVSECAANTYPAKMVGALHASHLYVSILSSRDNLHTLKVTSQDHNITTRAIGLKEVMKMGELDIIKSRCETKQQTRS